MYEWGIDKIKPITYVEKVVLTTILEESTVLDFGYVVEGAH